MRAIQVSRLGGPDVLEPADVPEPRIGPSDLLVRTEAIGINYIDTYFRSGLYPRTLPYVPGDEGSGVVESVGTEVTDFEPGDRVAWCTAPGSYAEKVRVPAAAAIAVPDVVPASQAASALLQGMTAHYLAYSTYPIREGDTVLVHAGAA
jgi:NADPH2:quinone reductase